MNNHHPGNMSDPNLVPLPAELLGIYDQLERDGAAWRTETQAEADALARTLAVQTQKYQPHPEGAGAEMRALLTGEPLSNTLPVRGKLPAHASGDTHMSLGRRLGIVFAGIAAVLVAALLITTLVAHGPGPSVGKSPTGTSGTPGASTPTTAATTTPTSGDWQTYSRLTYSTEGAATPLAIAPSNPLVIYKPTSTLDNHGNRTVGLLRTDDQGTTWHTMRLPSDFPNATYINAFVSPLSPNTVYLLVYEQIATKMCAPGTKATDQLGGNHLAHPASGTSGCTEEYVSTNGGINWAQVQLPVEGVLTNPRFIGPPVLGEQGGRLYATSDCFSKVCTRLLTSDDGGTTWNAADASIISAGQRVCAVAAAHRHGTAVFAVTTEGNCYATDQTAHHLWRSDDNGASWTQVGTLPTPNVQSIFAVDTGTDQLPVLYALVPRTTGAMRDDGYPLSQSPTDVKVSSDGGKTWQAAPTAGIASNQVIYSQAFGTLSDGSLVMPFAPKGYSPSDDEIALTLYVWKPGEKSWRALPPLPNIGAPRSFLVTTSLDGTDTNTLWVVLYSAGNSDTQYQVLSYTP